MSRRASAKSAREKSTRGIPTAWWAGLLAIVVTLCAVIAVLQRQASPSPGNAIDLTFPHINLDIGDAEIAHIVDDLRRRIQSSPQDASAWGNLAMLGDVHGMFDVAGYAYERAVALDPDEFRWHYNTACLCVRKTDNPDECIALFKKALSIRPDYAPAHVRAGMLLAETGRTDGAIAMYEQAINLDPTSKDAHRCIGQVLLENGETEKALTHLQKAQRLGANDRPTLAALSRAMMQLGRPEQAEAFAEQATIATQSFKLEDPVRKETAGLSTSPSSAYARAKTLYDGGRFADAVTAFVTVEKLLPRDPYAPLFRAMAALRSNDFEQAREAFALAEDRRAGLADAAQAAEIFDGALWEFRVEYLGMLARIPGEDLREPVTWYARAADRHADSMPAKAWLTWGTTLCRLGMLDAGLEKLRRAVEVDPEYAAGYFNIAVTLEELGRGNEAPPYYEKAMKLDPQTGQR